MRYLGDYFFSSCFAAYDIFSVPFDVCFLVDPECRVYVILQFEFLGSGWGIIENSFPVS
jgi:hypothetical protein